MIAKWRAFLVASGLALGAIAGYVVLTDGRASTTDRGTGRYRDGRGRAGREGPETAVAGCSTAYTACASGVTEALLYTETIGDANWNKLGGGGAAAPTVTANAAVGPDCATTATRVQVPAIVSGGDSSALRMVAGCPFVTNNATASVYLKGTSGSGAVGLCVNNVSSVATCFECSYTATAWSRCSSQYVVAAITGSGGAVYIGNGYDGNTHAASDFYAVAANCTNNATVQPYMVATTDPVACP